MSERSSQTGDFVNLPYPDRQTAGQALARLLGDFRDKADVIILALPRGGVPVAKEISSALGAPLDLLLVRKVGVPGHEELAMGAIASNNIMVWNKAIRGKIKTGSSEIDSAIRKARNELQRRKETYRGHRPEPELKNRIVILVDDGVATGASMRAAIDAVRLQQPERIIVAVPVAPPDTVELLREMADEIVCPATPEPFYGVAEWYLDFAQLTDEAVREVLDAVPAESSDRSGI